MTAEIIMIGALVVIAEAAVCYHAGKNDAYVEVIDLLEREEVNEVRQKIRRWFD